jgi:hypothetical protein
MITIKDQDFEMKQVKNLPFFDLVMPVVVNEGKDNERVDMKLVAYAIPFEACIKEIIAHRLGQEDKTYNIAGYISDFQAEVDKLCSLIKFTEPVSKKKKGSEEEDDDEETKEEELDHDDT